LREYAAGSERMDICVVYQNYKYPIELKIKYSKSVKEKGIEQLSNYMDTIGEKEGWLIIFDRNSETSWDAKISWETVEYQNKTINIVGC
jgi:alpha-L-fucosidase